MGQSNTYVRVHKNKTAFDKHMIGLKKRNATIVSVEGMTITYYFN
jgi:hypothetical protein